MDFEQRYEIRRKLGQGGLGEVYEGFDHQLQRKVAIKRLMFEEGQEQSTHEDLMRECHSLSALNSPNIVSLFDIGKDNDGSFVVMELLKGETLEELISRAPLTEEDFITIAEQCLEGLFAAHDAHILHRDLKPCNLMITWLASGRLQMKLLDFGLAKLSLEPSKQTIAHGNSLLGSIYFMAPEQFEQSPLDARTDLYSLGGVFYYALTQVYPFNGESVAQVMAAHLQGNYKDLREYRPDLNPNLCNWVMSLMALKQDDRPDSCEAALTQLLGVHQGTYAPAAPEGVSMLTHPVQVHAAAMVPTVPTITTVQIQLPTGPSAPVLNYKQPVLASAQEKEFPKWLLPALGILAAVVIIGIFTMNGSDDDKTSSSTQEKKATAEKSITEIKVETLAQSLRLEKTPETTLKKRDRNLDRMLTFQEFADSKFASASKRLKEVFPDLDRDSNNRLTLEELAKAYE